MSQVIGMEAVTARRTPDYDERVDIARELVTALENGDKEKSSELINILSSDSEASLFNEIGRLTREVHDAISNCSDSERFSEIANSDIPDARHRLCYVIDKTEASANKTLDIAERLLADAGKKLELSRELKKKCETMVSGNMAQAEAQQFATALLSYFQKLDDESEVFRNSIAELMVAQDFQDLTGQVIRQVIELVQEIEHRLVIVIKSANPVKDRKPVLLNDISAEGPQVGGASGKSIVNDQDDVDELLSSLGF